MWKESIFKLIRVTPIRRKEKSWVTPVEKKQGSERKNVLDEVVTW